MKLIEFGKRFQNEESCEQYLREVREREGVVCSKCGCKEHEWDSHNKRWRCKHCKHETTLTANTVMHGSKLPLMYWFTAIHLLTSTKKTFSALEMQRQLGHKRYQPIWEMMHKLRSVMGLRDGRYQLGESIELDEGYFSSDNEVSKEEPLKRGVGSQKKSKVLVMIESEDSVPKRKGQKEKKVGHIKMEVIKNLEADTIDKATVKGVDKDAKILTDNMGGHAHLPQHFDNTAIKTVPGKDAPKVLPWVHVAIANAKRLIDDMYHGVKGKFLQQYLNEFCYKFNRKYFGDRLFDRLVLCSVSYRPTFAHQMYGTKPKGNGTEGCG